MTLFLIGNGPDFWRLSAKYSKKINFILNVSNIEPRKNIDFYVDLSSFGLRFIRFILKRNVTSLYILIQNTAIYPSQKNMSACLTFSPAAQSYALKTKRYDKCMVILDEKDVKQEYTRMKNFARRVNLSTC